MDGHARRIPETRCRSPAGLEADSTIELQGVRVRNDIDVLHALGSRTIDHIADERTADSLPHELRLNEQIVELASIVFDREHNREADDRCRRIYRDPGASLSDRLVRRRDRIWMGRELSAVLLPNIG